jgi:flagellar motor switch/type III secretory pathway protein FliN
MAATRDPAELAWLDDVPVEIEATLDGPPMPLSEILALRAGSLVSTSLRAGESIGVFAGGARIGAGELSSRGGKITVRVVRFGSRA